MPATQLRRGDVVLVEAGDVIPGDGEVIEGVAAVNEAAITGESAPVIRESGGDRSAVTGGTTVISDFIKVKITANPGETFLDRMIGLVEGAQRQKTPNEIALSILLSGLTVIFLLVCVTLYPYALYGGTILSLPVIVALLVCLIPTTIGGLLSAIGIAGMDRLVQHNVLAMSGRAVEAAGDVDTLLLDKTGTITLGNRMATEFLPMVGVAVAELAEAAQLASLADETPEGRSITVLAKREFNLRGRDLAEHHAHFIAFSAQTRMSGVDIDDRMIRKGASEQVLEFARSNGGAAPAELAEIVERIAKAGGTPLVVADRGRVLGVIHLKDVVKDGIHERFERLRAMGLRTVMITGDNPLTAAAIAREAGVDDFRAEATPETKLRLIREEQAQGKLVAMIGDGTNDAPALAQADVGVAMNAGTQAAREAGNMIDLDSNPTKIMEVVEIGKQLLITRGALTTFSIANDVAKYFAIIPAMFVLGYPQLQALNVMHLSTPRRRRRGGRQGARRLQRQSRAHHRGAGPARAPRRAGPAHGPPAGARAAQRGRGADDQPGAGAGPDRGRDAAGLDPERLHLHAGRPADHAERDRRAAREPHRPGRSASRSGRPPSRSGPALKPGLVRLQELRNGVARELGYPDYFALQVAGHDMTTDEMLKLNEDFLRELKPLYLQLHTWAKYELAKKYGQPVPKRIPAHWIPNRWSQEWNAMVAAASLDAAFKSHDPEWIVQDRRGLLVGPGRWSRCPRPSGRSSDLYPVQPGGRAQEEHPRLLLAHRPRPRHPLADERRGQRAVVRHRAPRAGPRLLRPRLRAPRGAAAAAQRRQPVVPRGHGRRSGEMAARQTPLPPVARPAAEREAGATRSRRC